MNFNAASLLPLAMQIGELIKAGIDHYAAVRAMGGTVDADVIAAFVYHQSADWHPVVMGRRVLDDPGTRQAFVRFLGGVAVALSRQPGEVAA